MLTEILIVDLGVIARATVPLGPGLTVLTGETGAGKTMVLTGLALLLGGRADSGLVRPGADRAVVEGRWLLPEGHPALVSARDAGAELDEDGALVVVRTVGAEGRSRAALGGVGVPAAVLAGLADDLVAVHGQADQQRLARPALQRALVDRYAGDAVAGPLASYQVVHQELAAVRAEAAELTERAAQRAAEADGLRHGAEAVSALGPVAGEEMVAAQAVARLEHAEALAAATREAYARLVDGEDSDGRAQLVSAGRLLRGAADLDPGLAPAADRVEEMALLLADVGSELASYADGLVVDPAALAETHERTAALAALVRRYVPGGDAATLLAWTERASARVAELDGDADRRDELAETLSALQERQTAVAAALTAARTAAAERLTVAAGAELDGLALGGARLRAAVSPTEPGPYGADSLALLLAAHPGAPERPLGRGASGGELSRLMLALEVSLAAADPVPTMVFDEVDAGVGGAAAVEVGRRLGRLGTTHQVLVVTHLAQVAAFAGTHIRVRKSAAGGVTSSDVTVLADTGDGGHDDGRRAELARMLGGLADSDAALETAGELLALGAPSG